MNKNNLKGIGLQFFAEPAPEGAAAPELPPQGASEPPMPTSAEPQGADPAPAHEPKPEKTFTRDEVNRMIAAERKKAVDEEKARVSEAEKLSKMQEGERLQYEKEKAEQAAADAIAELNAYKLKDEAAKIAREAGLPAELLDLLDFRTLGAEQVRESIKAMQGAFQAAVEAALNEKLGQRAPSGGGAAPSETSRAAGYAQELSKRMQGVI